MAEELFKNIAYGNTDGALQFAYANGYQAESEDELADVLQDIAANGNENNFKQIMALHPDRDLIIEYFGQQQQYPFDKVACGANCANCDKRLNSMFVVTNQADGGSSTMNPGNPFHNFSALMQTNTLLTIGIIGMVVLGACIIHNKS